MDLKLFDQVAARLAKTWHRDQEEQKASKAADKHVADRNAWYNRILFLLCSMLQANHRKKPTPSLQSGMRDPSHALSGLETTSLPPVPPYKAK